MQIFRIIFFWSLLIFLNCETSIASPLRLTIDPGHGGTDLGAVYTSVKEADLVLKIAEKLKLKLEKESAPFEISMTRTKDHTVSLQDRVDIAKKNKSELFISLHANAVKDHRVKGIELFFQNAIALEEDNNLFSQQENQVFEEVTVHIATQDPSKKNDIKMILEDLHRQHKNRSSLKLNQIISQSWSPLSTAITSAPQITIKQAPFFVVSKTSMPSVLIELGFLSNPSEVQKLKTQAYQNQLVDTIFLGLVEYHRLLKKESIEPNTAHMVR